VNRLLLILCASMMMLLLATPAAAQPAVGEGGGSSEGDTVTVGVTVGEGFPGHAGGGPGANRATSRTGGTNLVTYYWRGPLPGSGCPGLGAEGPGVTGPPNDLYEYVRHDRTVEPPAIEVLQTTCFPPEAAPPVEPAPPPAPPTMAEITALAQGQVRSPTVGVSPDGDGLTGLETWFWYSGERELEVSTTIRGYGVTATMRPAHYYWFTGESLLGASAPGSPAAPAVRWTYETKGGYRIYVQAVWDGTWEFAGWGATASGDLATIRATGARDYVVNEVRSVLTG
jgi:hypothetical protein